LKIIAVSGYKDSGKSTLCRALLASLSGRGLNIGYIKRTQEYVASEKNTDSGAVNALGIPSLLWGDGSFRLEALCPASAEADPYEVAGRYFPQADIVILEGGKGLKLPKIWVLKEGEEPPQDIGVFALYDRRAGGGDGRRYGGDDLDRLVDAIIQRTELVNKSARVFIDDKELPMKDFVADFVAGGVRGMLGALKNPHDSDISEAIRVYLKRRG
jgi:molybdopterin-guanine dinucleotide biosynthesis protein B